MVSLLALTLVTVVTVSYVTYTNGKLELSPERIAKRDSAITRIYERKDTPCEQYVLKARYTGWFPILKHGEKIALDNIWLNKSEVWKYGKTCINEEGRYPGAIYYIDIKWKLTRDELIYEVEFRGSEIDCLVEEKRKIFNYPLLPECLIRIIKLIRPAGNKNDN